jgi:DNA-directed RNA polymerase specialized sigma24 family protein
MLDGMASASQAQKCLRLALIGFTNAEIAEILQTTVGAVKTSISLERKKPRGGKG